ncbi:DUF3105 domain-containing protein [Geodermatophilus sp. SYSU D00079]
MTRARGPVVVLTAALLTGCTGAVAGSVPPAPEPVTLEGTRVAAYSAGQPHVTGPVDYAETPPVGGPHAAAWADCTGSVYAAAVPAENAVHALEHGAVWITYDPALAGADDVATLTDLTEGTHGLMLSPYPDLGSTVTVQAWNHALRLDDVDDPRLAEFAALFAGNPETTPEPGAPCENPAFLAGSGTA